MAWQGRSMRLGWCDGQPLTAPARDDMGEARVGTKKRLSDQTKKLMKDKDAPACRNSLTKKAPYKAQAAPTARPKVLMRRRGADCLVVVLKRGNARGASQPFGLPAPVTLVGGGGGDMARKAKGKRRLWSDIIENVEPTSGYIPFSQAAFWIATKGGTSR